MKNILIDKIINYSIKEVDEFHNNVPRVHPRKGGYMWNVVSDGFYHTGPDASDFWSANGTVYSVQKVFLECDWNMHTELYQYSVESNEFRISKPIFYEKVLIKDEEWWYSEIEYPNKELGRPQFEPFLKDPYNTINGYIDDITILLEYCRKLHDKYRCYYPRKLKLSNRILDSKGYFWKDIKYWYTDEAEFMDEHVGEVQKLTNRTNQAGIPLDDELVEKAKKIWTKILTS
jgi:hypothetical protein